MTSKIFKNTIITVVITTFLTITLFLSALYGQFNNEIKANLKEEVNYIAQGISSVGVDYFDGLKSSNRITLIDEAGTVIYDNVKKYDDLENHNEREEIILAKQYGEGYSTRYSKSTLKNAIYYAKMIDNNLILRVSANSSTVGSLLVGMSSQIFWIFVISLLVAYLIAKKVSKQIVKPINEINLDKRDNIVVYKELNPLISKINKQNYTIDKQLKELNKRQIEFKAITDNMNEGLIVINTELKVLSYNQSALSLLSIDNVELGDSVFKFYHQANFIDAVNEALDGKNQTIKIEIDNKIYEMIISPVKDTKVRGATIIIFDRTAKEMQDIMRREFSANVSHELKTPLTSIIGFAEIMKNNMVDAKDVPEIATSIYDEAKRLIKLVEDLIHLSSLDEGAINTSKEDVDIDKMIKNVISLLTNNASKKDIKINYQETKIKYHGVYSILEEMIYNLVDNAIKYGKLHGTVDILVSELNDELIIAIQDDGVGISNDDKSRIFERFYRVDKSHSKEIGGTGLGLSIVKHGAIFHDGYVDVTSKLNEGSCFTIHLHK